MIPSMHFDGTARVVCFNLRQSNPRRPESRDAPLTPKAFIRTKTASSPRRPARTSAPASEVTGSSCNHAGQSRGECKRKKTQTYGVRRDQDLVRERLVVRPLVPLHGAHGPERALIQWRRQDRAHCNAMQSESAGSRNAGRRRTIRMCETFRVPAMTASKTSVIVVPCRSGLSAQYIEALV